jgi:hypothetical protein
MISVTYSGKRPYHISTATFAALTEAGISLQQHSTVPQQTFIAVVTLQWHVLSDTCLTALTERQRGSGRQITTKWPRGWKK